LKLTLVRHTQLQVGANICYGQSDIDVAHTFYQELAVLQTKLVNTMPDAIYSSPLQRCAKLANALNLGPVIEDERLKEIHFGDWEMQAWDTISKTAFDEWVQDYAHLSPPNGETFSQLQLRGVDFLNALNIKHSQHHVLIVTHGGMIRALVAHVLNMQLKGLFRMEVDFASITQLNFSGEIPKISYLNR
jgi:alpha-ribazole phosphatase